MTLSYSYFQKFFGEQYSDRGRGGQVRGPTPPPLILMIWPTQDTRSLDL